GSRSGQAGGGVGSDSAQRQQRQSGSGKGRAGWTQGWLERVGEQSPAVEGGSEQKEGDELGKRWQGEAQEQGSRGDNHQGCYVQRDVDIAQFAFALCQHLNWLGWRRQGYRGGDRLSEGGGAGSGWLQIWLGRCRLLSRLVRHRRSIAGGRCARSTGSSRMPVSFGSCRLGGGGFGRCPGGWAPGYGGILAQVVQRIVVALLPCLLQGIEVPLIAGFGAFALASSKGERQQNQDDGD